MFDTIQEVTGHTLDPSPIVALLRWVGKVPPESRRLIAMMLLLAKRRRAMHWGAHRRPWVEAWVKDVVFCQEQLSQFWELMPTAARSKDIWHPFIMWLRAGEAYSESIITASLDAND